MERQTLNPQKISKNGAGESLGKRPCFITELPPVHRGNLMGTQRTQVVVGSVPIKALRYDGKLPRDLRFKLEMIASKHDVLVRGYSTFEVVNGIAKSSNLTKSERETLEAVWDWGLRR